MKTNSKTKRTGETGEMRAEYDFSGGVRGKYCRAYRAGHTVRIIKANGSAVERHFTLRDGAVMIDPDIRRHFPDSKKVNAALRFILAH